MPNLSCLALLIAFKTNRRKSANTWKSEMTAGQAVSWYTTKTTCLCNLSTWAPATSTVQWISWSLRVAPHMLFILPPHPWMGLSRNQWQTWGWFCVSWSQKGTTMEGEESASFLTLDRRWLSWMAKVRSSPGILMTALGKIPRDRFQLTLVQPNHHNCKSSR